MAYLIDGNNLMWHTPGLNPDQNKAQIQLLERLSAFRFRRRNKPRRITVVFDGPRKRTLPDPGSFKGVRILYPQRSSNADEVIKEIVEKRKDKSAMTVVTSDRALSHAVRSHGVQVMTCREFNVFLKESFKPVRIEEKGEVALSSHEVDEWLRFFRVQGERKKGKKGEEEREGRKD